MDANQRSEVNNQTNNGANEKWTPGSKGKTQDGGPLDHSYPQGAAQQQGITDSHQQAMQQRSGAYGQLEQPVGDRPDDRGNRQSTQGGGQAGPQSTPPRNQGGSMGQQTVPAQGTQGGGLPGTGMASGNLRTGSMSRQSASAQGTQGGGQTGQTSGMPPVQRGNAAGGQESTDRTGSQTGNYQRETGVHQSNDSAGGLPRSPGNSGPYAQPRSTHLTGPDNAADLNRDDIGIHESNNSSGGLPRSPGGANKLAADQKMDDDTGFSNPRR